MGYKKLVVSVGTGPSESEGGGRVRRRGGGNGRYGRRGALLARN